jgi:hypothetical protein
MACAHAFDLRDTRAKVLKDDGLAHNIERLGNR